MSASNQKTRLSAAARPDAYADDTTAAIKKEEPRPLPLSLNEQDAELYTLEVTLRDLLTQLDPIAAPRSPDNEAGGIGGEVPGSVVGVVQGHTQRIARITEALRDQRQRLHI